MYSITFYFLFISSLTYNILVTNPIDWPTYLCHFIIDQSAIFTTIKSQFLSFFIICRYISSFEALKPFSVSISTNTPGPGFRPNSKSLLNDQHGSNLQMNKPESFTLPLLKCKKQPFVLLKFSKKYWKNKESTSWRPDWAIKTWWLNILA